MSVIDLHVGISLGGVAGLQDGLGEFALQIGSRIARAAPAWQERYRARFHFHVRDELLGLFGNEVGYLPVTRWQRLRHVQPVRYALWHSLHQLNKTRPPADCGPRVVTVHDLNYLYGRNAFSTWRHHRRTRALLARADHVVAISEYTAADVRKHLGWTAPLDVVLNGARSFVACERRPLPGWPAEPGILAARPFLFHLSRMSPSKNPRAIVELARAWPEMLFVLCGPSEHDSRQLRDAVDLPNVQFHLGIDDAQKAWAYAHCAGFLFPSLAEGFGLPPVEAMHFGKPVFLARRTSLPEIGGEVADYFDSFEGVAMRRVVEAGLARARAPGRADAIRRHAARFDWDRAAAAYLALYARLLGLEPSQAAAGEPERAIVGAPVPGLHDLGAKGAAHPCAVLRGAGAAPRPGGAVRGRLRTLADRRQLCVPAGQGAGGGLAPGGAFRPPAPLVPQARCGEIFRLHPASHVAGGGGAAVP